MNSKINLYFLLTLLLLDLFIAFIVFYPLLRNL